MRQFVGLGKEFDRIAVAPCGHVVIGHKHQFRIGANGHDTAGGQLQGDGSHPSALVEHGNHAGGLHKAQFALRVAEVHQIEQLAPGVTIGIEFIGKGEHLAHIEHCDVALRESRADAAKMAYAHHEGVVGQMLISAIGRRIAFAHQATDGALTACDATIVLDGLVRLGEFAAERDASEQGRVVLLFNLCLQTSRLVV